MKIGYIYGVLIGLMLFTLACNTKSNTRNRETPTDIAHIYELKRIALLSQFNEIDSFDRATGLARTQKGETYGYIDTTGKEIVPCINYNVQDFTEGLGLVQEHEDRGLYFVDKTGKKVIDLAGYSNAFSFKGGYATVEKNDKFGLIDKTGKEVIACSAKEGIFMLSPGNFIFYDGKAKSIVDANGKPSLPFTGFSEIYY
ncbi:MAG TPA: WG repeat-containing protein, partial [Phnomibacter sp.]|nr:WG repeat-containing protein [Phnomibacter sp.]